MYILPQPTSLKLWKPSSPRYETFEKDPVKCRARRAWHRVLGLGFRAFTGSMKHVLGTVQGDIIPKSSAPLQSLRVGLGICGVQDFLPELLKGFRGSGFSSLG